MNEPFGSYDQQRAELLERDVNRLQFERKRLRSALQQIEHECRFSYAHASTAALCRDIASDALTGKST